MTGEELKRKLKRTGVSYKEIADRLGMANPQSLYQVFKSEDVKTGLIEDLCRVLGTGIDTFYGREYLAPDGNTVTVPAEFARMMEAKDEQISRMLALLERMART